MEMSEEFYLVELKNELANRQRHNPSYSIRAFAKDLKIDSSNLSAILNKKRGLPAKRAKDISKKLGLSPQKEMLFLGSIYKSKSQLDKIKTLKQVRKYLLDDAYFHVLSEWEYFAFLQLLNTHDFRSNIAWIAQRLGITKVRAEVVIFDLQKLGIIEKTKQGRFKRLVAGIETSEDVESLALQKSHQENLDLAKKKLTEVPVKERDFSSVTMAVDPDKLPEAKAIIREFQEKLYTLMSDSKNKEVYMFNTQLFPVTKGGENEDNK